jgi:hypothetical protein
MGNLARYGTVVYYGAGTMLTGAVATHYGNLGLGGTCTKAKNLGHLGHHCLSAYGTHESVKRACLDASIGKTRTTGVSATATIGLRQHLGNLPHAWVFLYSKLLGNDKKHSGQN